MPVSAAYLVVVIIWSTTPLTIAWSGETLHPVMAAWLRMGIAAGFGWLALGILKIAFPWTPDALRSYGYATLGVFGAMCSTYVAARVIPSGLISVLFGLAPIMSALMAQRLLQEQAFPLYRWIACFIALAGLAVIFLDDVSLAPGSEWGIGLMLLAVFLFSLSGVLVKREAALVHPLAHTVGALLCSLPLFGLTWWLMDGSAPHFDFSSRSPWAVLYLALFGSLVGFVCYYSILRVLSPSTVALVTLITPVFALFLGHMLNGEELSGAIYLGTGLILSGLGLFFWGGRWLAQYRTRQISG